MQTLGRFDLDHELVVYDHVESLVSDFDAGVPHRYFELSRHTVTALT